LNTLAVDVGVKVGETILHHLNMPWQHDRRIKTRECTPVEVGEDEQDLLVLVVTNAVATKAEGIRGLSASAGLNGNGVGDRRRAPYQRLVDSTLWERRLTERNLFVLSLTTVIRFRVRVVEARDAIEVARSDRELKRRNNAVAEDRASREGVVTRGEINFGLKVNVQVVAEELRVLLTFLLHDGAVHEVVLVDEQTDAVTIAIERDLATVLPLAVTVSAARRSGASNARIAALV